MAPIKIINSPEEKMLFLLFCSSKSKYDLGKAEVIPK